MCVELTVTIKGEDSSYKQKFLLYEAFQLTSNDKIIKTCVEEALAKAQIEPEDIKIRALLVIR